MSPPLPKTGLGSLGKYLYLLNPKVSACSHLLCLYSSVCVRPVQKPQCWLSHVAHILPQSMSWRPWADPEGGGGQGVWIPPGIARLLIFAMLKFSVRPVTPSGNLDPPPPEKIFWICAWRQNAKFKIPKKELGYSVKL